MRFDSFEEKPHDLNELLETIVKQASSFTGAERTLIYLYDEDDKVLWNRAGQGAEFMELEFQLGHGIPGKVIESGDLTNIKDVGSDSRFDKKMDDVTDVTIKNMLCSPVIDSRDKKIGVIQIINKSSGAFDQKDEAFIKAMCSSAAIAIENTILFVKFQEIRKREQKLSEEIKDQNRKLQNSYRQIEEKTKTQHEGDVKSKKNWIIGTIGGLILIISLGFFFWKFDFGEGQDDYLEGDIQLTREDGEALPIHTVTTQHLSFPLTLTGNLDPSEITNVFAPFTGRILELNYTVGAEVKKGQELMTLDAQNIDLRYRKAKVEELNRKENYDKKVAWNSSKGMTDARRKITRAKEELDEKKRDFERSEKLHALGVISDNELEASKKAIKTQEDIIREAEDSLENVQKQGDSKAVNSAQYLWEESRLNTKKLKDQLDSAIIRAKADGVAIKPPSSGRSSKKAEFEPGMTADEGTVFISVANLTKLRVLGRVDEVDIANVKVGQKVRITGDAFPVALNGKVDYVSSEAKKGRKPYFEIKVLTDLLTEEQRKHIRLGMSAVLSIVTYSNPNAMVVPFSTIKISPQGNFVYKVIKDQESPEKVIVKTGVTTRTGVEILEGIKEGDNLLILTP